MALSNVHNLPRVFQRFEQRHQHSTEGAEFSVSGLIDSPQIAKLRRENEVEEDISDRAFAILGTAVHKILEDGAGEGEIAEERFHAEIAGASISGQVDLRTPTSSGYLLSDYKTCRTLTLQINPGGKVEWQNQLNCYAALARENGVEVSGIEVIAILRDWSASGLKKSPDYPQSAITRVPIELWEAPRALQYMEERVRLHRQGGGDCSPAERWARPPVFAVYTRTKSGGQRKRATKLFDSRTDAEAFAMNELGASVVERDAVYARCEGNFCGVREFCTQYREIKNAG